MSGDTGKGATLTVHSPLQRFAGRLKGRWAVITGGSSGIGLEFAGALAASGCNLLLVSNQQRQLDTVAPQLRDTYKVDVRSLWLDLTSTDAPRELMRWLDEAWIVPYILINNAGIFSFTEVADMSAKHISLFLDLHCRAVTELSRLVGSLMAGKGTPDEKGRKGYVLNMSSMSCWTPMPGIAMYAATKAYIRVFTRAFAYEMRDGKVSVMVACPGGIATDLFGLPQHLKHLAVGIRALDRPERFVRKALQRLLRGKRQYINGGLNRLTIVAAALTPTCVRMLIKRRMLDKGIRR